VGIKSITSLLRRPETRMFLGVILAAGAIAVMTMSGAPGRAQGQAPVQTAQAPAPKAAPNGSAPKQQPPPPQAPKPAQIDRNGVLILVRSTLLALDQANKTGCAISVRRISRTTVRCGSPKSSPSSAATLIPTFVMT
jgi:hypothetical protein